MTGSFAVMFAVALSAAAHAQNLRVAVVHDVDQADVARRLRAEIWAAGFEPVDVVAAAADSSSTAGLTFSVHAVAGLRTDPSGTIELVVIDSESGAPLDRIEHIAVRGREGELRAVEDLRAKLIELSIVPAGTPAEPSGAANAEPGAPIPPRTPAVEDTSNRAPAARSDRERTRSFDLWLQGAGGGLTSAGGLGASVVSEWGLRLEWPAGWSGSAFAQLPLNSSRVVGEQGSATMSTSLFGGSVGLSMLRADWVRLELGLGAAVVWSRVQGTAARPADEGRSESIWAGCGFGELSASWSTTRWMRLRTTLRGGSAAPRPTVQFDGESVASWGRPFVSGTLGLEFAPLALGEGT